MLIPLDVPRRKKKEFMSNYNTITKGTDRLMLFAGDQKVEHLNDDFYGKGISEDDADPEHLFKIASKAKIGCFATQLGLIARYGMDYPDIPYLVKLNSKTNLVPKNQRDPFSELLVDINELVEFKKNSGLNIVGVGYTLYLGSEYEPQILREAEQVVFNAHKAGLVVVLWMYPRGKAVKDEKDPHLIAGATGVAACLGADFVKVSYPEKNGKSPKGILREAVLAAGRTGVVCAGGKSTEPKKFLETLKKQLDDGARGNATGRNIHQRPLNEAIKMCNAIYALTIEKRSIGEAMKELE